AGVLAEAFAFRALGIEPVENMLKLAVGNARSVILDADRDDIAGFPRTQPNAAVRLTERMRVGDQVPNNLNEAALDRLHDKSLARGVEFKMRVLIAPRGFMDLLQRGENGCDVNGSG